MESLSQMSGFLVFFGMKKYSFQAHNLLLLHDLPATFMLKLNFHTLLWLLLSSFSLKKSKEESRQDFCANREQK